MMSLSDLKKGEEAQILQFEDSFDPRFRQRLRELGFYEGERILCLRRTPFRGPLIVRTPSSVFSLGSDVTRFIRVSKI